MRGIATLCVALGVFGVACATTSSVPEHTSRDGLSPSPSYEFGGGQIQAPCPSVPAPVLQVQGVAYYRDSEKSQIDPSALAQNEALAAPLRSYLRQLGRQADRAMTGDAVARACVRTWVMAWAEADALREVSGEQAKRERMWSLAGIALASWRSGAFVADGPSSSRDEPVRRWLMRLASAVKSDFDKQAQRNPQNLTWWAILAVGSASRVSGDRRYAEWVTQLWRTGLRLIGPDGRLAAEARRGARAEHYHHFALIPLLAWGWLSGEARHPAAREALARLVKLAAAGRGESVTQSDWAWWPLWRELSPASTDVPAPPPRQEGTSRIGATEAASQPKEGASAPLEGASEALAKEPPEGASASSPLGYWHPKVSSDCGLWPRFFHP